jgi:hypothetical protein
MLAITKPNALAFHVEIDTCDHLKRDLFIMPCSSVPSPAILSGRRTA